MTIHAPCGELGAGDNHGRNGGRDRTDTVDQQLLFPKCGPFLVRDQRLTIPACKMVKDRNTPTAYSRMSAWVSPLNRNDQQAGKTRRE